MLTQMEETNEYVVAQRRLFHQCPEVSLKEKHTSARICSELEAAGIPYEIVGEYGVVGRVDGLPGGKAIALRADIDALPMEEDTNLSFRSQNPGVMHSCGHDGHIAILLATGRHLAQHRDSFCGTVFLCFQQAEEIGEGHAPVIAYLKAMGGVSTVLSSHLWVDIPVGKISLRSGPVMAGTTAFRIKITGAGCHGSRPDQGIDPINAGVTLVGNVMRLKDREISPLQSNTLSFGLFHSGSATNIIPAEADLGGTMRFFSSEEKSHLLSLVERGCKATELLTRCKVACTIGVGLPPVVNWTECMPAVQSAAGKVFGTENIIEYDRIMASDNFGFYLQEFPGLYAFIGIGNKSKQACCAHHNPKFDLDEDALKLAVSFYLTYITENMGGK